MAWTPQEMLTTFRKARLLRVLLVYLGASFAVIEAVDILIDSVGLPDWVLPGAVVLLLLGLPIIVATALVQAAPDTAIAKPSTADGAAEVEAEPMPATTAADVAATAKHWLTWRKAIMGGLLAFALLGIAVTGYTVMRVLGIGPVGSLVAKGVLDEGERIILADFENLTADTTLAIVVTEALRIDLDQSPLIRIADHQYVAGVLQRMGSAADASVDAELAREMAIREGLKAIITGEVGAVGGGYMLSAEIGESLKSISANEPLAKVTTSSLDGLRKYTLARRSYYVVGDEAKALSLLEEAIALDSSFAAAWAVTGVILTNRFGERARAVEALTKAYELRDRMGDRERYMDSGLYWDYVMGEPDKAITAYRSLLDIYPDDSPALNNLANMYYDLREWERAEEMYRRSIEVDDSANIIPFVNIIQVQFFQGKYDEARASHETMKRWFPGHPWNGSYGSALASARGDYVEAEAQVLALREAQKESPRWRASTSWGLSNLAYVQGKLADGERHRRDAMEANEDRGFAQGYVTTAVNIALMDVAFRGDIPRGMQTVDAALSKYPLDSMAPLDRPYLGLANLYSYGAMPERAVAMMQEYEEIDPDLRRENEPSHHMAKGILAEAEGRFDDAIDELRAWDAGTDCQVCALAELGRAYLAAGEVDSALAVSERYVETPHLWRAYWDGIYLASTYERLGALYEQRGDAQKAIYYYGKLIDLWEDADPELLPRVEAARRAIAALSSDR
jgi:tetratricopeptide (TPR) repeat protein